MALRGRLRPRQRWRFKHRLKLLSFRSFAFLLLLLSLLSFGPALLFHFRLKWGLGRKCSWLRNRPFVCAHGGDTSRAPPNTITNLDAGYKFPKQIQNVKVPTLQNAIEHVSGSLKQVIIDAKVGPPMFGISLAADILTIVNKTLCKNCLIWSKVDSLVEELKMLSSEVLAGYIVMKDPVTGRTDNLTRMDGVEVVGVYHGLVNARLAADVHRSGKKLHVWTVNDREAMEKMLFEGVDCIVTSYPGLLQKVMLEMEEQCIQEGYSLI